MPSNKIACGKTDPGGTAWQQNLAAGGKVVIYVDIDTSAAEFSSTPVYVTSLEAPTSHFATVGASSVYAASPTGFRIHIKFVDGSELTPELANHYQWTVNWIGMET